MKFEDKMREYKKMSTILKSLIENNKEVNHSNFLISQFLIDEKRTQEPKTLRKDNKFNRSSSLNKKEYERR